jgi:glyoxylase-like metal-dependent hydrolase (beta-lactamase superfamily II)
MPEVRPNSPSVHALREGVFSVGLDRSFVPIAPTDPPARGALKLSINPFLVKIPASGDALHEAPARNILIDAGLGEFSEGGSLDALRQNLARHGLTELDITDVLLSHLHYDHMAGLAHQENGFWELTFPDATIWANRSEAEKALAKELFYDEQKTEFLHFIANRASFELIDEGEGPFPGFRSEVIGGHTEFSLAWSFTLSFSDRQQTFLMAGDVIGSKGALLRKYAAKYDFDAEKGMESREMLKKRALDEGLILLAYHDVESPLMRLTGHDAKSGYDIVPLGHDFIWDENIEDETFDRVKETANEGDSND